MTTTWDHEVFVVATRPYAEKAMSGRYDNAVGNLFFLVREDADCACRYLNLEYQGGDPNVTDEPWKVYRAVIRIEKEPARSSASER